MDTEILLEVARAIGRFFTNPLFYIAVMIAIYLGYRRVKRERKFFHIRILWGWSETVSLFKEGLILSLCISVISLIFGLTLPDQFLMVVTTVTCLGLVVYFFHILSPIFIFTVSLGILMILNVFSLSFEFLNFTIMGVNVLEGAAVTVTIVAGLLLVAEGLLISKYGAKYASPIMEKSKRGLKAVAFLSKKIWILPIFFIIPGDALQALQWWPIFQIGSKEFSIICFPIIIGFQQLARHTLPIYLYPQLGKAVRILGEFVLIGGIVSYFEPIIGIIVLLLGTLARFVITFLYGKREQKDVYAVSAKSKGVMIAAILPNSPAHKMGLLVGELIRKVNGIEVHSERELYEALQINAAHCRLEVLNHHNEVRLKQHVVHNGDHFRIGILVVE